jgi:[lysine-biosynthesis-protein LysW]--L-2-aminoadipate ligase
MTDIRVGMLFSRIRVEEKLLIEEARRRNLNLELVDSRDVIFDLDSKFDYDVMLERDVSHSRALYALNLFENSGVHTINSYRVAITCGDKVASSKALRDAGVPTPDVKVAFTKASALEAIERMGYPVVVKPVTGSWGRLIAKINDRDAAEAVLEHKDHLGSYYHKIFYIQNFIDKPQRDIRAFVVGNNVICAIYRTSDHWITNTARGAVSSNYEVTPELEKICLAAAKAVGGGVLAVDLMETDHGLTVHEVNYTVEFRNSIDVTGVQIPEKIFDYVEEVAQSA